MRRPWGLRKRVLATAGLIAAVSAITFATLLAALIDQQRAAGPARATTDALLAVQRVYRLALDLQTGARGYLLAPDRITLSRYDAARRELPSTLDALAEVPNTPTQRARIQRMRRDLEAYETFLKEDIARIEGILKDLGLAS